MFVYKKMNFSMDTVNIVNEKNYQRCFELYAMNLYMFQNKTCQVFDRYM